MVSIGCCCVRGDRLEGERKEGRTVLGETASTAGEAVHAESRGRGLSEAILGEMHNCLSTLSLLVKDDCPLLNDEWFDSFIGFKEISLESVRIWKKITCLI